MISTKNMTNEQIRLDSAGDRRYNSISECKGDVI